MQSLFGKLSAQNSSEIGALTDELGATRAVCLTSERIDEYVQGMLAQGYAPATCNRRLAFLLRAFNLAVERRHLNAAPRFKMLTVNNARRGFFSASEFGKVLADLPDDGLRDFASFAFLTAWRKSEIASLTWKDVHGDVVRLHASNAKNGEGRSVVLTGELANVLERRKAARLVGGVLSNLVFHRNGAPIREFRKSWHRACKLAGFPDRLFHDLRRSGVRNMVRAGISQHVAMKISGHKTHAMFRRYDICNEDDLRAAMTNVQRYNSEETTESNVVPIAK